jgi:hypothetical protein
MKLRHASTLALVGWYLMIPPWSRDNHAPISGAPMSQWQIEDSFDSADNCRNAKTSQETSQREKFEKQTSPPHNPFRVYSKMTELGRVLYLESLSIVCVGRNTF